MKGKRKSGSGGRKAGWSQYPSSGDLGALTRCELEYVLGKTYGEVRTAAQAAASERGVVEHDRAQARMESFHNAGLERPTRTAPAQVAAPADQPRATVRDRRCFIATAVYGETARETEQLRVFRDRVLMGSAGGRALVRAYYWLSPGVARWLESRPRWAAVVRRGLDGLRRVVCVQGQE